MAEHRALLTLAAVARWSGARSALPRALRSTVVRSVSNDSRAVRSGSLFVALTTERDDGNRYAGDALARGAAAALVNARAREHVPPRLRGRLLVVRDPLAALHRLATRYRRELGLLVIAVTGSSGKTTTRVLLQQVLGSAMRVGGTQGNLNNHIGVPISLLSLTGRDRAAVIEMGANHPGEIRVLARIARPDIAVVTNVGYAHIGLFGSLANTTHAKLEIAAGLARNRGALYVNGDDARLTAAARRAGRRVVRFGMGRGCDVRAEDVTVSVAGTRFRADGCEYRLAMPGRHFVYAALPAIALGRSCGLSPRVIAAALARARPASMRGDVKARRRVRFLLDCYNANPSSMQSALGLLGDIVPPHRRVVVVGDMLELGRFSAALHVQLGRRIAACGARHLVAVGAMRRHVARGARSAGMAGAAVHTAGTVAEAARALRRCARPGDTVLLKASRGMALERVYDLF